jgi:hypothetical protein
VLQTHPALTQLLDHGADEALLAAAMRAVAFGAVFNVLTVIDEGYDPAAPADAPGWVLMRD